MAIIAVLLVGGGIFVAVRAATQAEDSVPETVKQAEQTAGRSAVIPTTAGLGGTDGTDATPTSVAGEEGDAPQFLWDPAAAPALASAFDAAIAGNPTRFTEFVVYGDYALATAQNPDLKDHLDRYLWRDGAVGAGDPQPNDSALEGRTFAIADVAWERLGALMDEAAVRLNVENPTSRYFIIDHPSGLEGLAIRAYVSGARSSGYVLADATGAIVKVYG